MHTTIKVKKDTRDLRTLIKGNKYKNDDTFELVLLASYVSKNNNKFDTSILQKINKFYDEFGI